MTYRKLKPKERTKVGDIIAFTWEPKHRAIRANVLVGKSTSGRKVADSLLDYYRPSKPPTKENTKEL